MTMRLAAGPHDVLYRFGAFLADPAVGRLYHDAAEVPLTPKAFQVLLVLVDMRGRPVSKDELFARVWPDVIVEDNNLARNISMLRKVLRERDPQHDYIATLSGHGYRLTLPVTELARGTLLDEQGAARPDGVPFVPAASSPDEHQVAGVDHSSTPPTPPAPAARSPQRRLWGLGVLLVSATAVVSLTLGAASGFFLHGPGEHHTLPVTRLWQLTSTGHLDSDPSWSPDGQMVAYSSERNGRFGIWISRITGGPPVQVTSATARQWQPAWSPDGRYLAFRSESDGGGLFIVAAQGGTPRQIAHFGVRPQWSPDARRVLFFDGLDAYTVTLDGQPPAKLPSAAFPWADSRGRLAWHPDGRRVSAYVTNSENHGTFWTVAVDTNNGPAVRSVVSPEVAARIRDAGLHFGNFSWAPTGDALYFEGRADETQNLWRVRVDPKSLDWIAGPERLTTGTSVESGIALSPDGRRLAFDSRVERTVIWTLPFDPVAGQLLGRGEPVTPDTANAEILDMSPDGQHLAYRVTAHGRQELWIRSIRNSEERMRVMETQASIVQPKWSRDGAYLAYVRTPTDLLQSAAVVVLGARGNDERVFAATQSPEMFYDWSADGRSFLVRCGANIGRAAICLLPASAPPAGNKSDMQLVTSDASRDLYAAKRSPDERWISFIAARSPTTRSAVFVAPMSPRPVPADAWIPMTDGRYFDDKPRWSPDGRVLYFLSNRAGFWNLWGRRFDPDRGLPVGEPFQVSTFDTSLQLVRNTPNLQLAVTRDRLIVPITQTSGAIWVLENLDR